MKLPDDPASAFLLGYCSGLAADHKITRDEAGALIQLLQNEPALLANPTLAPHEKVLRELMARSILYGIHYTQIQRVVFAVLGKSFPELEPTFAPDLVFDSLPKKGIDFRGENFVFTGEFHMGRGTAEELAMKLGGAVQQSTRVGTGYVVVGDLGSSSWKFGKYGLKVMTGLTLRKAGEAIKIISENVFCSAIPRGMLETALAEVPHLKVDGFIISRGGPDMLKGPFSKPAA
jgi:hypothetical protein